MLEPDLPVLSEVDGGRTAGSYVKVSVSQYVHAPTGQASVPVVMVNTASRDYGDAVHYTADEARQVAEAMVQGAELGKGAPVLDRHDPQHR